MKLSQQLFASLLLLATSPAALAAAYPMKAVTVKNLTRMQALSPPVVIVHKEGFEAFEIGEPASNAVAALAEDGHTEGFKALEGNPKVFKVSVFKEAVAPGSSKMMTVSVPKGYRVSVLTMLVTTNDGFAAVRGMSVPKAGYYSESYANAYDSGSEANTESCAHIPGPPCSAHDVRMPEGAEGFVHMHAGIHGIADLEPSSYDWRGAVAKIRISTAD